MSKDRYDDYNYNLIIGFWCMLHQLGLTDLLAFPHDNHISWDYIYSKMKPHIETSKL